MNRSLTLTLVLGLLLGAMSTTAHAYESKQWSRWARRECRMGPFNTHARVRDLIRCAHRRVGQISDISMSLKIAERESGFNPKASNPYSSAGGLYQWLSSSWPGMRFPRMMRQFRLPNNRYDARAAAFVSARVMKGPGGFSPWCGYTTYC